MIAAVYFFVLVGAFMMGSVVSWIAKDYVEAFIDNAAYSKAITHPEMLNDDGSVNQEELIYLRFNDEDGMIEDEDDD